MLGRFSANSMKGVTQLLTKSGVNSQLLQRSYYRMPEVPYQTKGLSPFLSDKAIAAHLELHRADIDKANNLIDNTPYKDQQIMHTLKASCTDKEDATFFRLASSHFNHSFFWRSITDRVTTPSTFMLKAFRMDFGSFKDFQIKFSQNASAMAAPGYTWLVFRGKSLEILNTYDYGSPYEMENTYPLLCLDLHEHSYYLDYQNNKYRYIANYWNFIDWDFVEEKFMNALLFDKETKTRVEGQTLDE
ncbi:hypothetical protein SAMD00019534_108350 [Acytostelium subglobosum LB1]|uniref:hypothetical protein n=1 Tax=Acytostelium subglobosum LB1 TaxID=1410327 RepID=UPI00064496F4|nr:hypothetical protein SAMD00019534_108350 [Acytostelium subglobosum LB1]GAM27659.1 hypothetical protein SAMD00019534_108350 [Acytostelium subglobosum LB1]|eukprot:XP_012749318.1 hypothetical protein SAMD00019534_108350 [Acytostelium subglobosum LB1]